jgi:hypothetical protein
LIETLQKIANDDVTLLKWGKLVTCKVLIGVGDVDFIVSIEKGRVDSLRKRALPLESGVFAIRASEVVWNEYWQKLPKRNYHDLFSMFSSGLATIDGDLTLFMQNLIYFKLLLAAPRTRLGDYSSAKYNPTV